MMNKKTGLNKRYQSSYDSKGGNSPKSGIMNYRACDTEFSYFSPQEGKNRINIIPFKVKTKNHPLVKKGDLEIGDLDYVMDIFVHRSVGPSETAVLCLKQTYGKPCPICEQSQALRKQGKEDEANSLKAARRVFYNVEDLKEPGKLKIFETSHYLFEKELIDEARDDDEGGFIDFADPEDGKEIKFRCNEVQKGNMKYKEFKSFGFEDRDEAISDELLDSAISFDEIIHIPTYEEAEKILYGQDEDEPSSPSKDSEQDYEENDERPSKKPAKKDEDDEDEDEEKPAKKPSKKFDEDEDEEKPAKKPSKKSDEDDEKSAAKKECKGNCGECPFGHKFGVDVDQYKECDDCDIWDKCCKAK